MRVWKARGCPPVSINQRVLFAPCKVAWHALADAYRKGERRRRSLSGEGLDGEDLHDDDDFSKEGLHNE
jgi:hypothetical protein